MKNHRIFIAINLPNDIKKKISSYQDNWLDLPAKWTSKENLHITLAFLGNLSDEDLPEIFSQTEKAVVNREPFTIRLNKISYGPPKKVPPRMVWVQGEKSEELRNLQNALEDNLFSSPFKGNVEIESKGFTPHITLAKINQWAFRNIEPEERPQIDQEINLCFDVLSVEVMESELRKGGPRYTVLESINLKQ